ncbi:MAG: PKD domain-containing protein [Halobacteriota archaeon]
MGMGREIKSVWRKAGIHMTVTVLAALSLALALPIVLPTATATTISIGDLYLEPGENVVAAVMIDNVTNLGVANVHIVYESSVVHVTNATSSDLANLYSVIDNSHGLVKIGGVDYSDDGLSGDIKLADLTLKAVGDADETSSLNISIIELKEASAIETSIPAAVDNSTVVLNLPPVAIARSRHRINNAGSTCKAVFNGSASYDPSSNGSITNYDWNFGDGQSSVGEIVEHVYTTWNWNGISYEPFDVGLTVNDDGGLISTAILPVDVYITGDANGDGEVNVLDVVWVGIHWRATCNCNTGMDCSYSYVWANPKADGADMNNDCEIDVVDVVIIGTNWRGTAW